jgi:uncharacterized glyoxalase superfamily protein PhnB
MAKRTPKPEGAPWITPYLTVKDADAALAFYQQAFGFEKKFAMPGPNGKTAHAELLWRDGMIMLGPEGGPGNCKSPATLGVRPPVGIYVYCDDVDALFKRATEAGAKVDRPLEDMFWGDRMCAFIDPDGHGWTFATNIADFDPSKAPN